MNHGLKKCLIPSLHRNQTARKHDAQGLVDLYKIMLKTLETRTLALDRAH